MIFKNELQKLIWELDNWLEKPMSNEKYSTICEIKNMAEYILYETKRMEEERIKQQREQEQKEKEEEKEQFNNNLAFGGWWLFLMSLAWIMLKRFWL